MDEQIKQLIINNNKLIEKYKSLERQLADLRKSYMDIAEKYVLLEQKYEKNRTQRLI